MSSFYLHVSTRRQHPTLFKRSTYNLTGGFTPIGIYCYPVGTPRSGLHGFEPLPCGMANGFIHILKTNVIPTVLTGQVLRRYRQLQADALRSAPEHKVYNVDKRGWNFNRLLRAEGWKLLESWHGEIHPDEPVQAVFLDDADFVCVKTVPISDATSKGGAQELVDRLLGD